MKPTTYNFEYTWGSIARLPTSRTIKSRFLEQNSSQPLKQTLCPTKLLFFSRFSSLCHVNANTSTTYICTTYNT